MNVESGIVHSRVNESRDNFCPWMVVNRQRHGYKKKSLKDVGKESIAGGFNKFVVLKSVDEVPTIA